jgi:hypothetical protein
MRERPAGCAHTPNEPMAMEVWAMAAKLAASTLVVGVAATGCGSNTPSSPSSTTSSSATSSSTTPSSVSPSSAAPTSSSGTAQPWGYSNLLIRPTNIVVPGDTFTLTRTASDPTQPGISGEFTNLNGTRKVVVMIGIDPDVAAASRDNDSNAKSLDALVKGTPTPADAGIGGMMAVGTSPDGSKSAAVVVFAEGKTALLINFESALNDPLQPDFVLDVARKQDAAITAGLPA